VFGSGALYYSWWREFEIVVGNASFNQPPGWVVQVFSEDLEDESRNQAVLVNHEKVMKAAAQIAAMTPPERESRYISSKVRKECVNLLFRADDADLDAVIADSLLQFIVYGKVVFG
jgi:hypothetical protein